MLMGAAFVFVTLIMAAQTLGADAKQTNLVKNGDFENLKPDLPISHGQTGRVVSWTPLFYPATGNQAGVSDDAASGKKSVFLDNKVGKKTLAWESDFIPAKPGDQFSLQCELKTEGLKAGKAWNKPGIMVIYYDKDKKRVKHRDIQRFGSEIKKWTACKADFKVPASQNIAFMRIALVISYCKGKVFFDNVILQPKADKAETVSMTIENPGINIFPAPKVVEMSKKKS